MNDSSKFYTIFNNRRLHGQDKPTSEKSKNSSFGIDWEKSPKQSVFSQMYMDTSPSRRFILKKGDSLNVSDIPGAKPNSSLNNPHSGRDHIQVSDIKGAQPTTHFHIKTYNKNEDLMRDSILGKKKYYNKNCNPLDPNYIMKSLSGRRIMNIGLVDDSKPKLLVKAEVNKDASRYLRTDDITGASPKYYGLTNLQEKYDIHRQLSQRTQEQKSLLKAGEQFSELRQKRLTLRRANLEGSLKQLNDDMAKKMEEREDEEVKRKEALFSQHHASEEKPKILEEIPEIPQSKRQDIEQQSFVVPQTSSRPQLEISRNLRSSRFDKNAFQFNTVSNPSIDIASKEILISARQEKSLHSRDQKSQSIESLKPTSSKMHFNQMQNLFNNEIKKSQNSRYQPESFQQRGLPLIASQKNNLQALLQSSLEIPKKESGMTKEGEINDLIKRMRQQRQVVNSKYIL